jgi:hypothetical protein
VRPHRDGKEKIGETMLTSVGMRFVGVPIVLILESVESGATEGKCSDVL